jgi:hypothetical protein
MEDQRAAIVDLLINKSIVKQDIADYSEQVFASFKEEMKIELDELRKSISDERVRLRMDEKSSHEFIVYIGSDVLVFQLHSNVFRLPDENPLWKTDYMQENGANGYFGIINIYNFLAESFEKNRYRDLGYLIGRIFLNHNEHFMVEGKGQLGFLFRDLPNSTISKDIIRHIIQCSMSFAIDFELITPPYELTQEVSVLEVQALSSDIQVATGKRLGFKFGLENEDIF